MLSVNDKIHYVYLLASRKEEKYYIGVRTCKGSIDKDTYMGSSTCMTKEDKAACNKLILARFDTRAEAVQYEIDLHIRFNVVENPMFWNKAKQTSTGFDTSGRSMDEKERAIRSEAQKKRFSTILHPSKGRKLTEEHKEKISKSGTGLKRSSVTRAKIQKAHKERSAKHWKFEAWWYEVDGVKTEVFDKTIRQFAEEMEVNFDIVKDRFRSKFIGKELTRGPLKGYKFGRIKDGK